ncbi:MAG: hypothetical protein U0572_14645 [Phycisphaerales bacterium]
MPASSLQLLTASAALYAACGACAQVEIPVADDDGPTIVGARRPQWKGVDLSRFDMALEYYLQGQSERVKTEGQPTASTQQMLMRGTLNLGGQVFIGHRNLIDITGSGKVGIEQQWLDTDDGVIRTKTSETNFVDLYDVNARLFNSSQVPIDIYSRRDQEFLNRDFSPNITQTTMENGIYANVQSDWAPTTLHVFRVDNQQSDALGLFDYAYTQDAFNADSNIRIDDANLLEVNYTLENVSETQQGTFSNDYVENDLYLAHTFTFGEDMLSYLRSYIRVLTQSGNFAYDLYRIDEQLRLTHSQTLESTYTLLAERQTQQGIDQDVIRGAASVRHKLFDSLTSRATAGGQSLSTSTDFSSQDFFLEGSELYRKLVPYGRVDANVGAIVNFQFNGEQGQPLPVLNQPFTWNDPFDIEIPAPNVVPGSVVVTGINGFPTYQEGVDYTVQYFPDRVQIAPIIGGGIANGQTVLVDYTIGPQPSSEITTLGTTAGARYTLTETVLQGLSPYWRLRTINHWISTAQPDAIVLEDVMNWIFGVEYNRFGLTARVFQEINDSNTNPFDATRMEGVYDLPLGLGSSLSVHFNHDIISYSEPSNNVRFMRSSARWVQYISRNFNFNIWLQWRNEDSSLNGNSDGLDGFLGVYWHERQTSAYATIRGTLLGAPTSDTTSTLFEFGVTRNF